MRQNSQKLVERVNAMLVGELTQGGKRDLGAMRLDNLESEVCGSPQDRRAVAISAGMGAAGEQVHRQLAVFPRLAAFACSGIVDCDWTS